VQIAQLVLLMFGVFFSSFDWWQKKRCLKLKVKLPESPNENKGGHYLHFILKITRYLIFSALRDIPNLWMSHNYMKNQRRKHTGTLDLSDLSHTDNNESMILAHACGAPC